MDESYKVFLKHPVVLDTAGPIVYLGRLVAINGAGFLLEDADVHDCRDGHANKEVYINEARRSGIAVNRRRVLVLPSTVLSVSKLEDVVEE